MRLTLRTMLAYQDSVLEPNEAEELGRKIKESDFASTLIQRMRSVLKKVRMNAPKLDGKGMGNDANTVAEYLDSALPQDRVGDFERICLESDAHLAEVAGCHQILALVLGKPADVPESLRERVYALGNVEQAAAASDTKKGRKAAAAVAANGHAAAARPALEVPDYLRGGRQAGFWQILGTLAIGLLIGALLLRMMGPFTNAHPVLALFRGPAPVAVAPLPTSPAPLDNRALTTTPTNELPPERVGPSSPNPDRTPSEAPAVDPPLPVEPEPPLVFEPADAVPPPPPVVVADVPAGPEVPTPLPPLPEPLIVPRSAIGMDVGRYLSDDQVLAHQPADELPGEEGIWHRVSARAVLTAGERLVALPAFRPQIALASGVQVTLAGEASLRLMPPSDDGASRMSVEHGRLVIVTAGAAGAQVELDLGDVNGLATLVDADSGLAVSLKLFLPPGSDPETTPAIPVVELFNTRGRVTWDEVGKERVNIPTSHVLRYVGSDPAETNGPYAPPEWIDAKSLTGTDRQAALVLERLLEDDKPLNLTLAEALQHRQFDVRALAARCLAFLHDFEPLVKELSDVRQYSYWDEEFAVLRHAIQRGPETAALVKATLERLRPDQADDLYRLLWGYSPEQLAKDGGAALVEFLRSEQMDIRVLAFQNLVTITGAMEFYMPQKKPDDLKASIQNWKARQAKGTITYRLPPTPLESYKPLDKPPAGAAALPMLKGAVAPLAPLEP